MKLSPPKKIVFLIAVIIAVLGLVFNFIPACAGFAFWAELVAFVLLALGNALTGL